MFKKLIQSGAAMMAKASAALFGQKKAELVDVAHDLPPPVAFRAKSRNWGGPKRPAGAKLARMADEGRLTMRHAKGLS